MGFLKRFFSLRHNKQKAATRPDTPDERPLQTHLEFDEREHAAFRSRWPKDGGKDGDADATISRLLRSSSANYKVVEEADYTKLPPLPHPINTVSSRSTSALTITPTRSASVQNNNNGGGSYRVTVHKRQQLSATVFPNAYPPLTPRRPGIAHTSTPNLLATYSSSSSADGHGTSNAASTSTSALVDPRKIPITPRDANRLNRLRQDPSVVSLVQLYDDHGRLAENAFTTTPAPPPRRRVRARKSRRKSTFSELLGCNGAAEAADLQWAESCIAQQGGEITSDADNSISNASTSSLSSTDTPPLDSPATSTFNDVDLDRDVRTPAPKLARDPSASTVTGLEKEADAGFSSMVVELSVGSSAASIDSSDDRPVAAGAAGAPYLGPYRYTQQLKGKEKEKEYTAEKNVGVAATRRERPTDEVENDTQDRTLTATTTTTTTTKVGRKPSQRASQVFNFIAERRERRKSQELLQVPGSTLLSNSDSVDKEPGVSITNVPPEPATAKSNNDNKLAVKSASISRARSPSPLLNLVNSTSTSTNTNNTSRTQLRAKPAQSYRDVRDVEFDAPEPAPPSPVTLRALSPAPRPVPISRSKSNSCSQATGASMLRATAVSASASASTTALPLPLPASGTGTGTEALIGKPAKGSTAALMLLQADREREKEKERKKRAEETALYQWTGRNERDTDMLLPATSTPHPSKVAPTAPTQVKKVSFATRTRVVGQDDREREHMPLIGEMTNFPGFPACQKVNFDPTSFDWRYDAFAANLDARTQQLQMQMQHQHQPQKEKENAATGTGTGAGRVTTRRRGATIDLGLTRAATTQLSGAPASKNVYLDAPLTPIRSRSLRGSEHA